MTRSRHHRRVVLRDVVIFQIKLFLDGMKDFVLVPVSLIAAAADMVLPSEPAGKRFYAVLRAGERFDRWLSLFSAAKDADAADDGLFGRSVAGSDTMLGRLETMVTGRDESGTPKNPKSGAPR